MCKFQPPEVVDSGSGLFDYWIYTRWGKNSSPENATLIYKGQYRHVWRSVLYDWTHHSHGFVYLTDGYISLYLFAGITY